MRGLRFLVPGYALPAISPGQEEAKRQKQTGQGAGRVRLEARSIHTRMMLQGLKYVNRRKFSYLCY